MKKEDIEKERKRILELIDSKNKMLEKIIEAVNHELNPQVRYNGQKDIMELEMEIDNLQQELKKLENL